MQMDQVKKRKLRDKSFFFVWMACLLFSLFFIGYFFFLRTSQIDVTQHVRLSYSGENGSASVRVSSSEISVNQRIQDFYDSLRYTVTPNEGLKNGDTITISTEYDHELAKQYHLEAIHQVKTVVVEGLPDRYESVEQLPQTLTEALGKHADAYLEKHLNSILQNDFTDFYSGDQTRLESYEIVAQAFLKSKNQDNSDRLVVIYQMTATGEVNRSDNKENLQRKQSSIYYMVVFPSINDSDVINDANAYGEKMLLEQDVEKDAQLQQELKRYLKKKGRDYEIQMIETKAAETADDRAKKEQSGDSSSVDR